MRLASTNNLPCPLSWMTVIAGFRTVCPFTGFPPKSIHHNKWPSPPASGAIEKKKNNLIRSIYSFGRFQHPPRWAFMSIAHNCLVPRPLSATEVVADHRFVVIADTGSFDQNGTYMGKTILCTKNFMPNGLNRIRRD